MCRSWCCCRESQAWGHEGYLEKSESANIYELITHGLHRIEVCMIIRCHIFHVTRFTSVYLKFYSILLLLAFLCFRSGKKADSILILLKKKINPQSAKPSGDSENQTTVDNIYSEVTTTIIQPEQEIDLKFYRFVSYRVSFELIHSNKGYIGRQSKIGYKCC